MNALLMTIPAGQPSMIPPIASPCDSPNEVKRKTEPKVFIIEI